MAASDTRLAVANWKLNPGSIGEAKELFLEIRKEASRRGRVETVVAPPYPYLAELRKLTTGKHTFLGAQDLFWEEKGPYTGEVAASMLTSVGVSYVIVGHSERRALGEGNEEVAKKVVAGLKAGFTTILCVGEGERDTNGRYLSFVEEQLRSALQGVPQRSLGKLVVAYEPVWAIGSGTAATPEDVHEMTIFIRRTLTSIYSRTLADRVRILYGGSVNEENVRALIDDGMVDGFLVGGASLKPRAFGAIIGALHEKR